MLYILGVSKKDGMLTEITKIKEMGLKTYSEDEKKKCIDTLASYGESAIVAITEIADGSLSSGTRQYALNVIKRNKEQRT